jgi:hypothetical protein
VHKTLPEAPILPDTPQSLRIQTYHGALGHHHTYEHHRPGNDRLGRGEYWLQRPYWSIRFGSDWSYQLVH